MMTKVSLTHRIDQDTLFVARQAWDALAGTLTVPESYSLGLDVVPGGPVVIDDGLTIAVAEEGETALETAEKAVEASSADYHRHLWALQAIWDAGVARNWSIIDKDDEGYYLSGPVYNSFSYASRELNDVINATLDIEDWNWTREAYCREQQGFFYPVIRIIDEN